MDARGIIGIVVRVSDVNGRDKRGDRFISPAEQLRTAGAYCRAAGYDVVTVEPQDLNISHTTPLDDRPGMGEALRLVEAGVLAGIGVSSQDRIGTLVLTRELKARLLAAGAVLKVADNPSAEALDARGYLKLPSEYMSLMHEAQREEIGLRWASAQRNARERGVLPRREPYGYRRDKDGHVQIAKRQAENIREAFRLRAAGVPFAEIGRRYGWSHSTDRQRLSNPIYKGEADLAPAIVTRAQWEAAQAGRTKQPVPPGATTQARTLLGIAVCSGCGHTLKVVRRRRADGSIVPAYYCKNAASEPCTDRAYVHADDLEPFIEDWFAEALRSVPRMVDVVAAQDDLEQATRTLEQAEAELEAYVEEASALADRAVFRKGLDAREKRVEESRLAVHELSARVTTLPSGGTHSALWATFGPGDRRDVLRGFLDRVEVSRGASADLAGHVRIFWADGSLADVVDDEAAAGVRAA